MVLYIPFKALKVGKQKFQALAASSSQPLHTKRGRKPRSKEAPLLFVDEIEPITSTSLLTSGHINLAMQYISAQFPHIGGLYCTTLGASLEFPTPMEACLLQIIHDPVAEHWLVAAKGFFDSDDDDLLVYDSLEFTPQSRRHTVKCLRNLSPSSKTVTAKLCQKQEDGFNCGVFAIAFAIAIANNIEPSTLVFDIKKMRAHLTQCFINRTLTPFPTTSNSKSTRSKRLHKVFHI